MVTFPGKAICIYSKQHKTSAMITSILSTSQYLISIISTCGQSTHIYIFLFPLSFINPKMDIPLWRRTSPISQNPIHSNGSRRAWTIRAAFPSFPDLEPIYIAFCRSLPANAWSDVLGASSSMEEYIFLKVHQGTSCVVCHSWIYRYRSSFLKKSGPYL